MSSGAAPSIPCPRCGNLFLAKRVAGGRTRKYCGKACAFPGQAMASGNCLQCGTEFNRRADQIGPYCSNACAGAASTHRTGVPCGACGSPLQRANWQRDGRTHYCSQACKAAVGRTTFACYHCDKAVTRATWEVHDPKKAYCSKACSNASRKDDPVWQAHAREMQAKHVRNKEPTKPELNLYRLLTELVGEQGFHRQHRVFGRTPDAAIPELRLAIQADGDYWHGPDAPAGNRAADASFNALFASKGWAVLRLSESLLKTPEAKDVLHQAITRARASD